MKKLLTKIICILLTLTFALSLVACNEETTVEQSNLTNVKGGDYLTNGHPWEDDVVEYENIIQETNTVFYDANKVTDYKIVISKDKLKDDKADASLNAAQDLMFFMDSAGVSIEYVYDNEITINPDTGYDFSSKYISIGNTIIYEQYDDEDAKKLVNEVNLGLDGFIIRTVENTVIINSYGGNGRVYGAYGFLERNMGFRYYYKDEWAIDKDAPKNINKITCMDKPDFQSRYLDTATNANNADYMRRIRQHGSQGGGGTTSSMEGGGWVGGDQSLCLEYLKADKYCATHGSWYSGDGLSKTGQMCMATVLKNEYDGEGADRLKPLDTLFENMWRDYVLKKPNGRIFMLGINDNSIYQCKCDDCVEQVEQIGYSGQMNLLANALMKKVEERQKEYIDDDDPTNDYHGNRLIKLAFFAYLYTIEAPSTYDLETETYTPKSYSFDLNYDGEIKGKDEENALILHENIVVRIAPIASVNMHTHYDKDYNKEGYNAFVAWSQFSSILAVWDYGTTFSDYICPYPDWGVIQDDFKFYRYYNVQELLTQLPAHTSGTAFYALMIYLRSQLMWDMDQNVEWLMKDFFKHYYGEPAFEQMWGYFSFLRAYLQATDTNFSAPNLNFYSGFINGNEGNTVSLHGTIYYVGSDATWWPYGSVMHLKGYFDNALSDLEKAKSTIDPVQYDKYYERIQIESLFYRYMELKNFFENYDSRTQRRLVDEFEKYAEAGNLTQFNNGGKGGVQQVKDFIRGKRESIA